MRHQGIVRELALFRLTLRKLGPLYFVPHLFLYGLMPAAILGTSLASGLLRPFGRMSWLFVPVAAVLYMLLPWLTFGLANTLSFGNLNPPDPVALAFGAVVSAVGNGIGAGVRALRARSRDA